ncbi:MAG: hypothetical protein HDR27_10305, partial [Lachnospiraceae bacterium]|nr:hypothetical protein [Lachnospiraceae bacterium]
MKRIRVLICLGVCCFLTACEGKAEERKEEGDAVTGSVQVTGEQELENNVDEADSTAELETEEPEMVTEEEFLSETLEPTEILMENPSQEYYLTEAISSEDDMDLSLEKLTEETNEIIDTEEWFQQNELPAFDSFHMEDDTYRYEIVGDNYASGYLLSIYEKESGT